MEYNDFVNSQHQLSETDFDWLYKETDIVLPSEVRSHYLLFNGGEPEQYIYIKDGDKYVVQEFFSIRYGEAGRTIENNYRDLVLNEKVIPSNMVPFGRDPAGDFYCFDVATGSISIFRSESLPDLNNCITMLASSMTEFVYGLVEDIEN
ncbi:MAG: hypothetical protein DBP02_13275 [gamma proteobacterium symbiont of Ctena orbiculata]|nr:MAG: hypothetical protein DBP02_13275 [gamma proteobacterium symbiont of Ctena orbiculata]